MNNPFFEEIHGRFGFGCMRLPMRDGEVDMPQFMEMVDAFLEAGLNYFDTAHGYIDGKSELAIREGLSARYPRERFLLTNKLTGTYFRSRDDIRPLFARQLEACGVDYFDFYLMHAQNSRIFEHFKACRAYETALELKAEGKIRHLGISFHDKAEVLDRILTEYPQIEAVQIQFNYLDYEDPAVESRKVYETAARHGKPVIVMEPVKGGKLVDLPAEARQILDGLEGGSSASYALRFAAGFGNMMMVLSGMSTIEQMRENLSFMRDPQPLSRVEREAIERVRGVFGALGMIPCTGCRYCVQENKCPVKIAIPELFSILNEKIAFDLMNRDDYQELLSRGKGRASDCVRCGGCEAVCPQHLPIRELLERAAELLDR